MLYNYKEEEIRKRSKVVFPARVGVIPRPRPSVSLSTSLSRTSGVQFTEAVALCSCLLNAAVCFCRVEKYGIIFERAKWKASEYYKLCGRRQAMRLSVSFFVVAQLVARRMALALSMAGRPISLRMTSLYGIIRQ